jgi:hypothetical protein
MARATWVAILAAIALTVLALPALAQGELILYDGNVATAPGGLELARWGSGVAETSSAVTYVGPEVIQLSSHGFFAGGVLRFTKSVDLGALADQQDAYLEMQIKPYFNKVVEPATPAGAAQPAATVAPTPEGGPPSGFTEEEWAERGRTAPAPAGGAPAGGPSALTGGKQEPALMLEHFRLVLKTDKGYAVLPWWPVNPGTKDAHGWMRVDFPLRGFEGELGTHLEQIAVCTDKPDRFYLGRLTATTDPAPMQVTVTAYPTQGTVSQQFVFIATVKDGLADPEVRWDLNMDFLMAPDDPDYAKAFDAKFKVQTTGKRVTSIFAEPGTYVVGYMVVDKGGAKPPVRRTLTVTVNAEEKKPEAIPGS